MKLTSRQRAVIALVCEGLAIKQIADRLGVSISATKRLLEKLFSRLDVHSSTGLATAFLLARGGGRLTSGRTAIFRTKRKGAKVGV